MGNRNSPEMLLRDEGEDEPTSEKHEVLSTWVLCRGTQAKADMFWIFDLFFIGDRMIWMVTNLKCRRFTMFRSLENELKEGML